MTNALYRPRGPGRARRALSTAAAAAVLATLVVVQAPAAGAATEVDFTDWPGMISAQHFRSGAEGNESAVDNDTATKVWIEHPTSWMQFQLFTPAAVDRYAITSAKDDPDRDPRTWRLEGSNNGFTFTTLDSRTNETFANRRQTRSFSFTNSTAYRFYRLRILAANGGPFIQLAEWQLFGPSATPTPLTAPSGLNAAGVNGDQVLLRWSNLARWGQTSFDVERSTDGQNWSALTTGGKLTSKFHDFSASPSTSYRYRVRGRGAAGVSAWTTTPAVTTPTLDPPPTARATNGRTLNLTYRDPQDDVAIYTEPGFDDTEARWMYPELAKIWRYTRQNYHGFGADERLQVWLLNERGGGGTALQRIDPNSGYRNTIEAGWVGPNDGLGLDVVTHEIGHLVDGWRNGVSGSPGAALWGDSMWNDAFTYDVYLNLGWTAEAQRVHAMRTAQTVDFPREGTSWFRDWFFPIYDDHGGTEVYDRFFELVATHVPTTEHEHLYPFNYGEFVHFWSGATGVDLTSLATQAFGWPAEYQEQLEQARQDFPGVVYPHS